MISFSIYRIKHCFICCHSDSTVSEDAGIEPRTVATSHWQSDALTTRLDLIHRRLDLIHNRLDLIRQFFASTLQPLREQLFESKNEDAIKKSENLSDTCP